MIGSRKLPLDRVLDGKGVRDVEGETEERQEEQRKGSTEERVAVISLLILITFEKKSLRKSRESQPE